MPSDQSPRRRRQVAQHVIDSVKKETVYNRIAVLDAAYIRLARIILQRPDDSDEDIHADPRMGLNLAVLTNALYSYFYDAYRTRHFNGSDRINKPKKAAYLVKWISKEKPIWFIPEEFGDGEEIEILSCINELYAFRVGLGYAQIPTKLCEGKITDDFVYELVFRSPNEGMMAFWFETFMGYHGLELE